MNNGSPVSLKTDMGAMDATDNGGTADITQIEPGSPMFAKELLSIRYTYFDTFLTLVVPFLFSYCS
jgi:hypothetical protein